MSHIMTTIRAVMSDPIALNRIFTALLPHFKGQHLTEALLLWQNEYANRQRFSQRQFALAVSSKVTTKSSYNEILSSIIDAMAEDEHYLLQAPRNLFTKSKSNEIAPARTFSMLLFNLGKNLNEPRNSAILNNAYDKMIANGLSDELANAVLENMTTNTKPNLIRLRKENAYRNVIHAIYVSMCESLGPVKADELLSDSTKEINRHDFGTKYSANNFL